MMNKWRYELEATVLVTRSYRSNGSPGLSTFFSLLLEVT
jgi:hypothetical protein